MAVVNEHFVELWREVIVEDTKVSTSILVVVPFVKLLHEQVVGDAGRGVVLKGDGGEIEVCRGVGGEETREDEECEEEGEDGRDDAVEGTEDQVREGAGLGERWNEGGDRTGATAVAESGKRVSRCRLGGRIVRGSGLAAGVAARRHGDGQCVRVREGGGLDGRSGL